LIFDQGGKIFGYCRKAHAVPRAHLRKPEPGKVNSDNVVALRQYWENAAPAMRGPARAVDQNQGVALARLLHMPAVRAAKNLP
jgi:hypothetical protein